VSEGPTSADEPAAVIGAAFAEHAEVLKAAAQAMAGPMEAAARLLVEAYRRGGKAILFGNGGSMTDALHVEGELLGRFGFDRPGVPAVALGGLSALTAIANDYGYEDAFARMLAAQAKPGDVAVGFSTSGNSENVVRALRRAGELHLPRIALTGAGGGRCAEVAEVTIAVPSQHTPRVQELHILAAHTLCDLIERALFRPPAGVARA
jgi:D-sedoheptulose 7-phosphate isomerase